MKNISYKTTLLFIATICLQNIYSQNQSLLLPVPGDNSLNPAGTCQMINFGNPANPTIVNLPAHPFQVNYNSGNPRFETDLYFATPSMDEYYLGQHPMYAQNITYDENGDILFFIIDNNIYNRLGQSYLDIDLVYPAKLNYDLYKTTKLGFDRYLTADVSDPNDKSWKMLSPEIIVFPIANKCYTYGVIYSLRSPEHPAGAVEVYYKQLTIINKQYLEMTPTTEIITQFNIVSYMSQQVICGMSHHLSKTISKQRDDGSRIFFLSYYTHTFMFNIDSYGTITLLNNFPKDQNDDMKWSLNPEMELTEIIDPVTQVADLYRLAVPMTDYPNDDIQNGYAAVMLYEFDYNTLTMNQVTTKRIELPKSSTLSATEYEMIKGMEFSPNGSKLFITYFGQNNIYYYDFDQTALYSLSIANGSDYQFSSIELGTDENLYFMAIDNNSNGVVSRLNNPDNPNINGWQYNVFPNTTTELFFSYEYKNLPSNLTPPGLFSMSFFKKLIFMDQIDGETYTNIFPNHWGTCCHPYNSVEWPSETEFIANCNPVWIWEPGDNPFGNTTSTVTLEGTVEIPAGESVHIINMKFEFADDAQLILNRGSELLLDGTSMTGKTPCGSVWKGILVLGQSNQAQTSSEQGRIKLINQSLIADAIVGIETGKSPRFSGAVIQAKQSTFKNCKTGIKMHTYYHSPSAGVYSQNDSYFEECTFITSEDAPLQFQPESFIDIKGIELLRIEGNLFINERINWSHQDTDRGIGIKALNSSIIVTPKCTAMSTTGCDGILNTFNKLYTAIDFTTALSVDKSASTIKDAVFTDNYRGIWANSPIGMYINSCEFYNNYRGIYMLNSRSSIIVNCSFELADYIMYWTGTNARPYGIYMDEGNGFKIEENVFVHNPVSIWGGTLGIIINNTGAVSNEVYRNHFPNSSLGIAIQAQYSNKGEINSENVGLMILCNQFENPNHNINVLGKCCVIPNTQNIGISPVQGIPNPDPSYNDPLPAGNSFSPAHTSYPPFTVDLDFSNIDAEHLLYYHDVSSVLRLEPDRSSYIGRQYSNPGSYPYCASKVNTQSSITQRYSDLALAETTWKSSELIRSIWKNGGIEDLQQQVEMVLPWESYTSFNELMSISPYVAADALIAMIENPAFTDLMLKLVCVANPHSSRNEAVLQALYNRTPPLPESYIEDILDESGAYSRLEQLDAQVAIDFHACQYIIEEIKRYYRIDTTGYWVNDSLADLLSRQEGLLARYELAHHYLITGLTEDFQTTIDDIPILFELTGQQTLDHAQFVTALQIALVISTDSIEPGELDSTHVANLEEFLEQDGSIKKAMAVAVLKWNNRNHHYTEPILEAPAYQPRRRKPAIITVKSEPELSVFPNPARDYFTLKYRTDHNYRNIRLIITNNLGQTILNRNLEEWEGGKLIDTRQLLSGAYSVHLYNGNILIKSQKLIIIK